MAGNWLFNIFMQKSMTHAVISCVNTVTLCLWWDITVERDTFKWLII